MQIFRVHKRGKPRLFSRLKGRFNSGSQNHCAHGFSILEVLVVLVIMGLMLSIVGARMITSLDASRFARTVDAAMADIRLIRADAMLSNNPRTIITDTSGADNIPQDQTRSLSLPDGWRVTGDRIFIAPSGVCSGGQLRIFSDKGRVSDYDVIAPKCAVQRIVNGS